MRVFSAACLTAFIIAGITAATLGYFQLSAEQAFHSSEVQL